MYYLIIHISHLVLEFSFYAEEYVRKFIAS